MPIAEKPKSIEGVTVRGPHYNPKFRKWEILWRGDDGSYGGAWGNTRKDAIEMYNYTVTEE